jgi:transcriptional regulator with XRE-family HTH domain
MEAIVHWTQNSTADFIYSISSNFVAQIETKMEEEGVSQNEVAEKMNKTGGRVSQILNNPGNCSIRVMVELARALGMKVSILAYDDSDPGNDRGPIDPDVFVKCWERAGRPANLFEVEDASAFSLWDGYLNHVVGTGLSIGAEWQNLGYDVNIPGYIGDSAGFYSTVKAAGYVKLHGNFQISAPQVSNPNEPWHKPFLSGGFHEILNQQKPTTLVPQENRA